MSKYSFSSWLKFQEMANYGLDDYYNDNPKPIIDDENPYRPLNVEYVVNRLNQYNLGVKPPKPNNFCSEVQWGEGTGAIKLTFGPYGGLRAVIRKLSKDLYGENVWICKRVVEIKGDKDKAETLIQDLLNVVTETDQTGVDSPTNTFKDMEELTLHLANELKRKTIQRILFLKGIKEIRENKEYIIHFGCYGMGRQRRGQKRLDQFDVQVNYENNRGLLKISGTELGDTLGQYRWIYDPSEFSEYFMPTQTREEIIEAVLHLLNSY